MRQIISRYSDDAANQTYPTCRSILLLENPSPSLKSSKIACLFNSFAAFIHSFNKETLKLFHTVKIVFAKHNSCIQLSKENQTGKIHIIRYACELCVKHCRRLFRTCIIPGFKKWTVNQKEINEIEKE
jgi:hypothetical protein